MLLRKLLPLLLLLGVLSNGQAYAQWRQAAIKAEYQSQYAEAAAIAGTAGTTPARREFRIAHDSWTSYDKFVDHGFGAFALAYITASLTHAHSSDANRRVFYWSAAFWTGNEIKDGFMPWEKFGAIGGDGFSIKDLVWSLGGAGLGILTHQWR